MYIILDKFKSNMRLELCTSDFLLTKERNFIYN